MDYFIPAEQLKSKYRVFGCFYNLVLENGETLPCRSRLEICPWDRAGRGSWDGKKPEALFVLMNPGKCSPRWETLPVKTCSAVSWPDNEPGNGTEDFVLANPDTTQYQVMRVMTAMGWMRARVINLSDIRQPNSKVFFLKIKQVDTDIHSIFSERRAIECLKALDVVEGAPIILAWGTDSSLLPLARMCKACLVDFDVKGIEYDDSQLLYYHASPLLKKAKVEWLTRIIGRLQANSRDASS